MNVPPKSEREAQEKKAGSKGRSLLAFMVLLGGLMVFLLGAQGYGLTTTVSIPLYEETYPTPSRLNEAIKKRWEKKFGKR